MAFKVLYVLVIALIAVGAHAFYIRDLNDASKFTKHSDLSDPSYLLITGDCTFYPITESMSQYRAVVCYDLVDLNWLPKKSVGYHCTTVLTMDVAKNITVVTQNPPCVVMGKVGAVEVKKDDLQTYINNIPDN